MLCLAWITQIRLTNDGFWLLGSAYMFSYHELRLLNSYYLVHHYTTIMCHRISNHPCHLVSNISTGLTCSCHYHSICGLRSKATTVRHFTSVPLLLTPLVCVVALTGFRPKASGQLDGETRTDPDLLCSLQPTDQRVCGRHRQQGRYKKDAPSVLSPTDV